jgi:tRNA A37 threonylcarbamoyladenosine dehydratase
VVLTKLGKMMRKKLIKEYGLKKGIQVFYSMEHKHKNWTKKSKR